VTAPATGTLTNFASVTNSTPEPTLTNNTTPPVITVVLESADVSVTKTAATNVTAGQNLAYTITVTNAGPSAATNVIPSDALPNGVAFVSATSGGTSNNGAVTWPAISSLSSGGSASYTLVVTAPANSATLTNFASVTTPTPDPTPTNNTTPPVITTVTPSADIAVTKSGPAGVALGTSFSYTIAVTNGGPSIATSLSVTDSLPAGLIFVSASPSATTNGSQVVWSFTNFAANFATNLTLTVNSTTRTTVTNFATGGSPVGDPNLTNNTGGPVVTAITNRPPVANPDSTNTLKNVTVVINPLPNDTDPDNDPLTITSATSTNGIVTFTGTNVTFTPNTNFTGAATITYTISDGNGGTATGTITVNVANQPPIAVNDTNSTPRNIAITLDPRANDSDPDNDPLTITFASPTNGTVVINGGTNITFTPATNFQGTATIGYTISDGANSTNAVIFISVTNRPPTAVNDSTNTVKNVAVVINPLPNDTDADGDTLTITNAVATNGVVTFTGTNITFTPTTNFVGVATVTYTITDGFGGSSTATIFVTVSNQPPTAVDDNYSTPKNVAITVNPRVNDTDPDNDPLTITSVSATNGVATIIGGTNVLFTPLTNFLGTATIGYTITDGLATTNALITISITNRPPVANPDTTNTLKNVTVVIRPLVNDTDPDGDPLTITNAVSTNGVVTFTGTNITFVPNTNFTGSATITYTITDGNGGSSTTNITVNVANQPPIAVNDTNSTPRNIAITLDPRTNDSDPDGDPLTITFASPTNGTVVINGGTNITFTPATNFLGVATIGYTISDGTSSTNAIIFISVTNRPPVAVNDTNSIPKNTTLTFDPRTNDTDADGDVLTIVSVNATNGTAQIIGGTNVAFTPTTNFIGTATIGYTIIDGFGGTNSAVIFISVTNRPPVAVNDTNSTPKNIALTINPRVNDTDPDNDPLIITSVSVTNGTAQIIGGTNILFTPATNFVGIATIGYTISDGTTNATALITVSVTNRPPTAVSDSYSTPRNVAITVDPRTNDTDPDNDALTLMSVTTTNGTVSFTGTNVTFTPATNFQGTVTLPYSITDGFGATNSAVITVSITNRPPLAVNDSTNTFPNVAVTVRPLGNDSDADGDTLTIISVSATNGTAQIIGGTNVVVTPATNFTGAVTVGYTIIDGFGGTNSAVITVIAGSRPPVAVNDTNSTPRNVAVTIRPLLNDSDPDNDVLTVTSVSPTNGTAQIIGGTNVLFTPATNFVGLATIGYTITDGFYTTNATIFVTVSNRPPIAVNDVTTGNAFIQKTISVLTNDSDPDGDTLILVSVTTTNGTASVNGNNVLFTPNKLSGVAYATYTISDGHGGTNSALVIIAINNTAPVAVNDTYGVPRNTTLTFDPRVNDTDANSDPLTITSVTATNGSVSFTGTSVTYTPVSNFLGTVYLPYTITDGAASSSALITINITNRPPVALNDTNNYTTANTPVTVRPLLNDSDPDLDPLTVITVTPTNGTAQIVGGTNVVFTPATNFTGLATIGYKISDGHGGTNSALIYVNVNPGTPSLADVAVFMSGPTNVIAGNAIVYTITVTNMGPQPATNVILVDTLPPGTYFVSTVVTGGITNGIVTWPTIGVLPAGGTTNYTLTLYTTNLGYITNVAYASSVTPDPNLVNNNGTLPASQARTLVNPFAYTYGATNIFNPQTGLYEETVTVTNTGGTAIAAMRVYATGLPATVILQNSIGTSNGAPFVQYNGGLVPGQVVTFLLEFLSTDRRPFTNGIIIEGTLPIYGSTNAGTFVTNIVIFSETYPGTLTPHQVVEFATIPGHVYTILYSDDGMDTWSVATPTLTATANVVQWIDSGPPKTVTKPANRFYQVIQSP
jgi:hypothetical protein